MIKLDPSQIGKEVTLGVFPVSAAEIREFAEVIEDLNPLYLDADAARAAGYPNILAPPMFYLRLRGALLHEDLSKQMIPFSDIGYAASR